MWWREEQERATAHVVHAKRERRWGVQQRALLSSGAGVCDKVGETTISKPIGSPMTCETASRHEWAKTGAYPIAGEVGRDTY